MTGTLRLQIVGTAQECEVPKLYNTIRTQDDNGSFYWGRYCQFDTYIM